MAFAGLAVLHLLVGAIALGMIMRSQMKRVQLMQETKEEVSRSISVLGRERGRTDMAVHHENEFGVSDTEVDTDARAEDHEGKTHPFTEVDAGGGGGRTFARTRRALDGGAARRDRAANGLAALDRAQRPAVFLGAAVLLGFLWGYRRGGGRVRTGGEIMEMTEKIEETAREIGERVRAADRRGEAEDSSR